MGQGPIYRKLSIPLVGLISILGTLHTACVSRQTAPVQASNQQPTEPSSRAGAISSAAPKEPPRCPPFTAFPEPPAFWTKGEHKVILSWKASAPGDAKHADAVGYCIYRGLEPGDRSLVRVNSKPFPGTSCTDGRVQNGKTYYYKVKAISAEKKTSDATKVARARIPKRKPSNPAASPPPPCREPDSTK